MQSTNNLEEGFEPKPKALPELSTIALPGIVGEFVDLATRNSEADKAAVLATFLARFSIEIGPEPFLMIGDTKHYVRLFTVIVGATSKARKGTSSKPVDRLFNDSNNFVNSLNSQYTLGYYKPAKTSPGPLSSGEGLLWQVSDQNPDYDERKRLYILDEEFAAALRCTERPGNTLSTTIRKLWDTGNIEPLTKRDRIKVNGAHVGIVTHITMDELNENLKAVGLRNGLANRFIWIFSRRSKLVANPQPMPQNEIAAIQEKMIGTIRDSKKTQMKLTCEASDLWESLYPEISRDRPGITGSVINRAEAQIMRLAMTYALIDGSYGITVPHLEAAIAFWEYAEDSAIYIFSSRSTNKTLNKIIACLQSGPKNKTELHNAFGNNMAAEKMDATLAELVDTRLVECKKKKSTGPKPKTIYMLRNYENTNL